MKDHTPQLDRLLHLWASGFARRWHQNAVMSVFEDFNCAHQGRCGVLVIALFPDHSHDLLKAVITHDAAEFVVGDLSQDFKKVGGELVSGHALQECNVLNRMGFGFDLSPTDRRRLKLVDRLDAYLFVQLRAPHEVLRNGWPEANAWLRQESRTLGCGEAVRGLLWDSERGAYEGDP